MQQYSDEEIIALLDSIDEKNNNKGLKILYQLFFPTISRFILNNSGIKEDVEDVFQDGIIVLFNQIKKKEFVLTSKLKTYFYSICRNIWLKKIAQRKLPTVTIEDREDFIKIEAKSFETLEINEEQSIMLELINQLGKDCKALLTYFYYDRFKMREIAKRMNFANDQVARNKKVKCLKQLTKIIDTSSFFKNFFSK